MSEVGITAPSYVSLFPGPHVLLESLPKCSCLTVPPLISKMPAHPAGESLPTPSWLTSVTLDKSCANFLSCSFLISKMHRRALPALSNQSSSTHIWNPRAPFSPQALGYLLSRSILLHLFPYSRGGVDRPLEKRRAGCLHRNYNSHQALLQQNRKGCGGGLQCPRSSEDKLQLPGKSETSAAQRRERTLTRAGAWRKPSRKASPQRAWSYLWAGPWEQEEEVTCGIVLSTFFPTLPLRGKPQIISLSRKEVKGRSHRKSWGRGRDWLLHPVGGTQQPLSTCSVR